MPKKKQETPTAEINDNFDNVSKALRNITQLVSTTYMGLTQRDAIKALICGLLTKGTVLLYGSHGTYKTSMSKFLGNLFTKPVYTVKFSAESAEQLKSRLNVMAEELGVDEDMLARNLLAGIDIQYAQYGGKIEVSATIDAIKYTMKGEKKRVPLDTYVRQVNTFSEQEDVIGYGIDNPLLLKDTQPHMVKHNYMASADFIVLDEVFKNPRLISILHNMLNDREYDSVVGTGRVEPEAIVLLTNPLNDNYQTNVSMVDFASLDRYMFSAFMSSPTTAEIRIMQDRFNANQVPIDPLPIEALYEARQLYKTIIIPPEIQVFVAGLLSAMSKCYFNVEGNEKVNGADVFAVEHDCGLCKFGGAAGEGNWSICSKANVAKVRSSIAINNAIKANAFIEGRRIANDQDAIFALKHVLPHRIKWSADFKADILKSTDEIIKRYNELLINFSDQFNRIEEFVKSRKIEDGLKIRNDNKDVPAVLAFLDEFLDRMKEVAISDNDNEMLAMLDKKVDISGALKTLGSKASSS
nr:AAA family ATPase [Ferrimicrobium acidiphilum]